MTAIMTIHQGRSTWQGPQHAIPAHLRAAGGRKGASGTVDTPEGEAGVSGALCASGDLVSREAVLRMFQPETSVVRLRICEDIRALPAQGQPAAPVSGWDAHAEFKDSAAFARKALKHVCGDMSARVPTVGKHEAINHEHLRRIFEEAKEKFPRFADTLAWLLWHDILHFDRLALLVEDFGQPAAPAVKVKPLVWQGSDPDYTHADCSFGRYTVINTHHDRGFMLQIPDSRTAAYTRTMGEAQAAAQADYQTRILAALEGGAA